MNEDLHLIRQVRAGKQSALKELFARDYQALVRILYSSCRQEDLAQDLAQESFLKVWQKRDLLKDDQAFFPYLVQIGKNLLKDHYKYLQVREKHKEHVQAINQPTRHNPHEIMRERQLQDRIAQSVKDDLPTKCREIFEMSRFQSLNNQAIAEQLNITKKTVENQLYKALQILKKKCHEFL